MGRVEFHSFATRLLVNMQEQSNNVRGRDSAGFNFNFSPCFFVDCLFTGKTQDVLKLDVSYCSLKISCLQVSERNRDQLVHELSDFLLKNLFTS